MASNAWKKIGLSLAKIGLPLLGSALGPAGGLAGAVIADVLGGDPTDPADLEMRIAGATPEQIAALKQAQIESGVELKRIAAQREENRLAADTSRILSVNQTMRSEGGSEKWYVAAWRPFWGFISALSFAVVSVFVCFLAYKAVIGGVPTALNMIPQLITSFTALFAIPGAILGVAAWHRGKMQREKLLGAVGS